MPHPPVLPLRATALAALTLPLLLGLLLLPPPTHAAPALPAAPSNSSRAYTAAGTGSHANGPDKVYLRSITALVFSENGRTRTRSGRGRPQLSCVGGSAAGFFWGGDRYPHVVQCENIGWDGASIQWRCHAELKQGLVFGDTVVMCEGYDSPGDEYVFRGSCRLEYTLNYSSFQLSFMHIVYGSVLSLGMLWVYYQSRFTVHMLFRTADPERASLRKAIQGSAAVPSYQATPSPQTAFPSTGSPLN